MIDFAMPSLGADMEDGTLVEWRVKPGDIVKRGDIIAEVDTQKGLIEVEVFDEGVIHKLMAKKGSKIPVGSLMAQIIPNGQVTQSTEIQQTEADEIITEELKENEQKKELPKETRTEVVEKPNQRIKISPLAKVIAKENGVDFTTIEGSGPEGSIIKKDIENFLISNKDSEPKEPQPIVDDKEQIHEKVRMAIAAAMSKSNSEIPHFYLETKVNMSETLDWLLETNKERTIKNRILPVALFLKSMALALKEVPAINATWDNGLQLKSEVNIGFAISLRQGGVVIPAIHNVDQQSLEQLMAILNELIPRAKSLKLRSSELADANITLTNIGEGSVEKVFGLIYPPQVALVGFGSITEQPWTENGGLLVRPILSVVLAADHRAIDGHLGSRFLTILKNKLQNPMEL